MKLQIQIKNAKGLKNVELAGVSDPYCSVTTSKSSKSLLKTQYIENNLNPVWDYTGTAEWDGTSDLIFTLYDSNVTLDRTIAKVTLPHSKVSAGFDGVLNLEGQGTLEVCVEPEIEAFLPHGESALDINFLYDNDLIMWRRPVQTGGLLLGVDVAFFLCFFAPSPLLLACKAGMVAIGIGAMVKLAGAQVGQGKLELIPESCIDAAAKLGVVVIVKSTSFVQYLVSWQSQSDTIKALGILYVLQLVSGWISFFTVAFTALNLVFVVPVTLRTQKQLIETSVEPGLKVVMAHRDKIVALIPKFSDLGVKED